MNQETGRKYWVSFVVPVFNSEDTIIETLSSITRQNTIHRIEIIVVDDGSSDASLKKVQNWSDEQQTEINIIQQPHAGEAAAMNRGIEQARGDIVAWVESDVILDSEWLRHLINELEKENVAGAGGLLFPAPDDSAIAKMFGYEITHKILYNSDTPLHITSANALYWKSIFDELGPCREELGESSFDSEYNQRIRKAGYSLRFSPEAKAWHHYKSRLSDCLIRAWWYGLRRPFVESQALYRFDQVIGLLIVCSVGVPIGLLLSVFYSTFAVYLILVGCLAHFLYSMYFYVHFRDSVLLYSAPVYWTRNIAFFTAYCCGWVIRLSQQVIKKDGKRPNK